MLWSTPSGLYSLPLQSRRCGVLRLTENILEKIRCNDAQIDAGQYPAYEYSVII